MPDSSDPAAILAGIRERASTASTYDTWHLVGRDVSRLLVAVEAALKLADDAEEVRDYSGPETHGRLVGWRLNPAKLREAITSALTGTQPGEDEENQ